MFQLVGADVYINSESLPEIPRESGKFKLIFISNRGTKCWPGPVPDMELLANFQCRYEAGAEVSQDEVDAFIVELGKTGFVWTKVQHLYMSDGERQYSQPY
ncbi:MAG: hypothetical protein U0R49_06355 [Fimbriimonadales bacterium]